MMTDTPPRPDTGQRPGALRGRGARTRRTQLLQLLETLEMIDFRSTSPEGEFTIEVRHRRNGRGKPLTDLPPQLVLVGAQVEEFFRGFQAGLSCQELTATVASAHGGSLEGTIASWAPTSTFGLGIRHGLWADNNGRYVTGMYEDQARELLAKLTQPQ